MQSKIQNLKSKIVPPPLKPGDLLQVIAPSGALREFEAFQKGVEIWRSRGYQIELTPQIDDKWGYLAGKDEQRRDRLATAWADSQCRGILCARGGFGSTPKMHILELLYSKDFTKANKNVLLSKVARRLNTFDF